MSHTSCLPLREKARQPLTTISLAALSLYASLAQATTSQWTCSYAEWATPTCWNPTVLPKDAVQINGDSLVSYGTASGAQSVNTLNLGSATGTAMLLQNAGLLTANTVSLGADSAAIYRMQGSASLRTTGLTIGVNGSTILQSSGARISAGEGRIVVNGLLSMSAGYIVTNGLTVAGSVTQTGGTVEVDTRATIYDKATYTMTGGSFYGLEEGRITNSGTIVQTGGLIYSPFRNDGTYISSGEFRGIFNNSSVGRVLLNGGAINGTSELLTNSGLIEGFGQINGDEIVNRGTIIARNGAISSSGRQLGMSNVGQLTIAGNGSFDVAKLSNTGTIELQGGGLSGGIVNQSTGQIRGNGTINASLQNLGTILVDAGSTNIVRPFNNEGTINLTLVYSDLRGAKITNKAQLLGQGYVYNDIDNTGLIEAQGHYLWLGGTIANLGGTMSVKSGSALYLGKASVNKGWIRNASGLLDFVGGMTNSESGVISGQGVFTTGSGLTNSGVVSFSSGNSSVVGSIRNDNNGIVTADAGANVTFYDNFQQTPNGILLTHSGSTLNFLGVVSSSGMLGGDGTATFGNIVRPGDAGIASLVIDMKTTLTQGSWLEMQIGGSAGSDKISFLRGLTLDRASLRLQWSNGYTGRAGDSFDLIDASAQLSFLQTVLPVLTNGLDWDLTDLANKGVVRITQSTTTVLPSIPIDNGLNTVPVPEPSGWLLALVGSLTCGALARQRKAVPSLDEVTAL